MRTVAFAYFVLGLLFTTRLFGQNFKIQDTICVNEILEIDFIGESEEFCLSNYSNFLEYDISASPVLGYPESEIPLFSHFVMDQSGNYFGFVTNFRTTNIVRLEFGNSLLNVPTAYIFPIDEISQGIEGIQVLYDNNQWWGFLTGGNGLHGEEFLLRLNFGNSLSNIPSIEDLGNIGEVSFPHDLYFAKENNSWIGITISKFNNTLTRYDFGGNLSNMPSATNLGNIGNIFHPTGLFPIGEDGAWHLFVTNSKDNSITRLDFTNLSSVPMGTNLGSLDLLNRPRDLMITKICDQFVGLVLNRTNNEIILLEFQDNITSLPHATSLGNFANFSFPHSISDLHVTADGLVFFVCNVDSKELVRVLYKFPEDYKVACRESISEFQISYDIPGAYDLNVVANPGLLSEIILCKKLVVLPSPALNLGTDTIVCDGESITISTDYDNTIWQNEFQNSSYEIVESQEYIAEVTQGGCTSRDTVAVEFKNCDNCLYFPNIISPHGVEENDTFLPIISCDIDINTFSLEIYSRWGEKIFQSADPQMGWNGYFNNHPMNGVYVWKTEISYYLNNKFEKESLVGDITVIR